MSTRRPFLTRPRPAPKWLASVPPAVPELVMGVVGRIPPLRTLISRLAINSLAYAVAPRPRPLSMVAPYTSWKSLTDRTFTGRHLPPADAVWKAKLPTEADVVALFMRESFTPSTDTSVLFSMFAQWFTDSFLRTDPFDPTRNTSNHEIDLCQIYGLSEPKTDLLRLRSSDVGQRGRLRSQLIDGQEFPAFLFEPGRPPGTRPTIKPEFQGLHDESWLLDVVLADAPDDRLDQVFAVGLEHGNSTIGNTIMNVVFLREHNRVAGLIEVAHPDWDDERVFQTTRNVVIVLLLHLVVEEYIKHIAPFEMPLETVKFIAEGQRWNRSNWIAIEFNLLYRWHSLVPDAIGTGADKIDADAMRNNNPLVIAAGIEVLISRCSNEQAGKIGLGNTPWFLIDRSDPDRPSVEERTVHISRVAELRSFNEYREAFGLKKLKSFDELTSEPVLRSTLSAMYGGDIGQLEWYVGIFAEKYPAYMMMGELLSTMVACDAFTQALTNPLLGRHVYGPKAFSAEGLEVIETTKTLHQIVARNSRPGEPVECSFRL